jgi:hypothetical protein
MPKAGNRKSEISDLKAGGSRGSAKAGALFAVSDFGERLRIGGDRRGNGVAVDELAFAPAGDESGFAEDLEMMRDGCGSHATHGDNFAASHVVGCRDSLEDPEAGLVGQSLGNFLDLGTVHRPIGSVAESLR